MTIARSKIMTSKCYFDYVIDSRASFIFNFCIFLLYNTIRLILAIFVYSEYGEEFVDLTDLQNELGLNQPISNKMNLQLDSASPFKQLGSSNSGGDLDLKFNMNTRFGGGGFEKRGYDKYDDID